MWSRFSGNRLNSFMMLARRTGSSFFRNKKDSEIVAFSPVGEEARVSRVYGSSPSASYRPHSYSPDSEPHPPHWHGSPCVKRGMSLTHWLGDY
ncbi:hypothetical protein E2C01_027021 [Portunus trituberculatus]|uniref:Uncharacterized protein n=1 Tax=Portunus trituberculatus TaxID=210409 RepID=A0A5B7EJT3_PORTR|nr:hypothetical protein [Portunus trituberculatus]